MVEGYGAGDAGNIHGIRTVFDFGFRVQYLKNTFRCGDVGNKLVVEAAQVGNGAPEHTDVVAEGN